MGRILADDFVLVTGSGKTHTTAELLAEARREQVVYEHQQNTEQTVRVWGDTAVVTAKLLSTTPSGSVTRTCALPRVGDMCLAKLCRCPIARSETSGRDGSTRRFDWIPHAINKK